MSSQAEAEAEGKQKIPGAGASQRKLALSVVLNRAALPAPAAPRRRSPAVCRTQRPGKEEENKRPGEARPALGWRGAESRGWRSPLGRPGVLELQTFFP